LAVVDRHDVDPPFAELRRVATQHELVSAAISASRGEGDERCRGSSRTERQKRRVEPDHLGRSLSFLLIAEDDALERLASGCNRRNPVAGWLEPRCIPREIPVLGSRDRTGA